MNRPIFRRVIEIRTAGDDQNGAARVALEDDYHHFRVQLTFAQGKITHATGTAIRTPYTACGGATAQLSQLKGMPLDEDCSAANQFTDQRMQCTHMLDEAGLGVACAARCIKGRRYDIAIPRHIDGATLASLHRDGVPVLSWHIRDGFIAAQSPYLGVSISRGFARWSADNLNQETREAALVLRRCAMISLGRLRNLDTESHARPTGHCFAQQPGRAEQALRIVGSTQDYTEHGAKLCAADQSWLDELHRVEQSAK
ncbi:DUF2889 domain-containing protein [Flavobacteriaceae bacterium]|nr:DUF2889 domain-containing protein [Flavobacteriaceae bacterium]